ncbi:hypothetical protein [Agromyces sp. Soil535]|uniref:hypothetical protein n=1 Tax=Agromyces sp. Soil535 TaxID=1736390 RepID=UPI0006FF8B88|nr:hypothetical protein [Agromyces sp. Soil535]KRE31011.1 hypothetical protein ASG80_00455 [Agromyces sp. Soil535]
MSALTSLARTWPMLSALGGGLVLLALGAGAGGAPGGVLAGAGIAGLGWGVLSLRAGRAIVPGVALGVSAALLVGAGALIGTGLAAATDVRVGPLLAASVFIAVVAGHTAFVVRRRARAEMSEEDPTRPALEGRLSLAGLAAGALLVAGLATPALAATEAGELAVPHGEHGGSSVTDADHGGDGHGGDGHHH